MTRRYLVFSHFISLDCHTIDQIRLGLLQYDSQRIYTLIKGLLSLGFLLQPTGGRLRSVMCVSQEFSMLGCEEISRLFSPWWILPWASCHLSELHKHQLPFLAVSLWHGWHPDTELRNGFPRWWHSLHRQKSLQV